MTRELFITRRLYEQVLDYLADEEYEKKIQKWRARQGGEGRHEPLFLMANGKRMSEKAFTPAGTVFAIARPGLLREMCSDINPMICGQRLRPIFTLGTELLSRSGRKCAGYSKILDGP